MVEITNTCHFNTNVKLRDFFLEFRLLLKLSRRLTFGFTAPMTFFEAPSLRGKAIIGHVTKISTNFVVQDDHRQVREELEYHKI